MSRRALTALLTLGGALTIGASSAVSGPQRWIWNATASVPEGLYRLQPGAVWRRGDLVAVRPTADLAGWLDRRGYAPKGVLLIKRVAALAPSTACRTGAAITVDGAVVAKARSRDRVGRNLPVWSGCRLLTAEDVFLLNRAEGSLDSRYLGPLPRQSVVGRVTPLWLIREHRHDG